MQRIDENTYIDDTLVTCAEYQLFIDEMRAQGKYYQPDHWSSYKFPDGQALQPILGVRHSDAVEFCNWLIQREEGEWKYRLPTRKEVAYVATEPLRLSSVGFWLNELYQFSWIGPVPANARRIDFQRVQDFRLVAYPHLVNLIDQTFQRTYHQPLILDLYPILDSDLFKDLTTSLTATRTLDHAHIFSTVLARDLESSIVIARSFGLDHERDHNLTLNINRAIDRILELASASKLDPNLVRARDRALTHLMDLYIDMKTLQERIARRSPAFEGMRLVKERIR